MFSKNVVRIRQNYTKNDLNEFSVLIFFFALNSAKCHKYIKFKNFGIWILVSKSINYSVISEVNVIWILKSLVRNNEQNVKIWKIPVTTNTRLFHEKVHKYQSKWKPRKIQNIFCINPKWGRFLLRKELERG